MVACDMKANASFFESSISGPCEDHSDPNRRRCSSKIALHVVKEKGKKIFMIFLWSFCFMPASAWTLYDYRAWTCIISWIPPSQPPRSLDHHNILPTNINLGNNPSRMIIRVLFLVDPSPHHTLLINLTIPKWKTKYICSEIFKFLLNTTKNNDDIIIVMFSLLINVTNCSTILWLTSIK